VAAPVVRLRHVGRNRFPPIILFLR
jgi:hypothetical protein